MTDQMQELYDSLPTLNCKGLCWNSCGPIDMSELERERIVNLGVDIPRFTHERAAAWAADGKGDLYCPALSFGANDGQMGCTVYEARPLICRVWGMGEDDLSCPHGCELSERMSNAEIMQLIVKSMEIGGHRDFGKKGIGQAKAIFERLSEDPEYAELAKRLMNGDKSVERELRTAIEKLRQEI